VKTNCGWKYNVYSLKATPIICTTSSLADGGVVVIFPAVVLKYQIVLGPPYAPTPEDTFVTNPCIKKFPAAPLLKLVSRHKAIAGAVEPVSASAFLN